MATTPTTPPNIADLSTPPTKLGTSDTVFVAAVDTFFSELPNFGDQQNDLADWEKTTATQVYNNALEAEQSAIDSASYASLSEQYADLAQSSANFKGEWSSATGSATVPSVYYHNGTYWQLLVNVADITATEPSSSNTDYALVYIPVVVPEPICSVLSPNLPVERMVGQLSSERASTATYTDIYGIIRTVGADFLREEDDGYLIEKSSTNKLLYSTDASNAAWTKQSGVTVTANVTTSCIDGELADKIENSAGTAAEWLGQSLLITDTSQKFTATFLVKKDTLDEVGIRILFAGGTAVDRSAVFDFTSESFSNVTTGAEARLVKKLSNDFYMLSITANSNGTNTSVSVRTYAEETGSWFLAGAQFEESSATSSFIKTTSSTATRAADNISIPTLNNVKSNNVTITGTIENLSGFDGVVRGIFLMQTSSGFFRFYKNSTNNFLVLQYNDASSGTLYVTKGYTPFESIKFAVTVSDSEVKVYVNGESATGSIIGKPTIDLSGKFYIGSQSGSLTLSCNMKNIKVYNGALTQRQIKAIA